MYMGSTFVVTNIQIHVHYSVFDIVLGSFVFVTVFLYFGYCKLAAKYCDNEVPVAFLFSRYKTKYMCNFHCFLLYVVGNIHLLSNKAEV